MRAAAAVLRRGGRRGGARRARLLVQKLPLPASTPPRDLTAGTRPLRSLPSRSSGQRSDRSGQQPAPPQNHGLPPLLLVLAPVPVRALSHARRSRALGRQVSARARGRGRVHSAGQRRSMCAQKRASERVFALTPRVTCAGASV